MKETNRNLFIFTWRVTAAHTIAYFIAGIFAILFMNYREHFNADIISQLMRPMDSPWIALGAGLQVFRGIIIALVLYPFRNVFLNTKRGWISLWLLIAGLSYISTLGPTFGSFEGYIYTRIAFQYHALGIPEMLLYTLLFSISTVAWNSNPNRIWNIVSIILVILILLMSLAGFISAMLN